MYELNIRVRNKIAAQTDKAEYVCGNSDYIAVFDLDSEWDAYDTKTARFSYNGSYTDVVFDGNQCPVPVITDTFCFHIGIFAGDLHTTTAARVACKKSVQCGSGTVADPPDDVYNQIMELLNRESGVWYPSVKDGYVSWNRSNMETEPEPVYIQGEKGNTGEKGEKGDTGEKGEKGDTGEPGISVSNASVGQTVKITAVDAAGKPTAWEAVDMPGGGEVWETILDKTFDGTSNAFDVILPGNERSGRYDKVHCEFFPGEETLAQTYWYTCSDTTGRDRHCNTNWLPFFGSSKICVVDLEIINGRIYLTSISINSCCSKDSANTTVLFGTEITFPQTFSKLRFWAYSSTSFKIPAGARAFITGRVHG